MNYKVIIFLILTFASCSNDVEYGQMWREKVTLSDGKKAYLYHSRRCKKKKPYFAVKEDMIYYTKMKNDYFDFCFSKYELDMLSAISRCNIYNFTEYYYPEDDLDQEYYNEEKKMIDTTKCDYYDIRSLPIN